MPRYHYKQYKNLKEFYFHQTLVKFIQSYLIKA